MSLYDAFLEISIHAPHAGCDPFLHLTHYRICKISIHAPHAGCDAASSEKVPSFKISIHAPHAGCDLWTRGFLYRPSHFNPRTPCGVRLRCQALFKIFLNFNPRTPCGVRRRVLSALSEYQMYFNPRTPCGVRLSLIVQETVLTHFNPRTPCGVRLGACQCVVCKALHFNPRTPCGVRPDFADIYWVGDIFQSTHPMRGATKQMQILAFPFTFQSTHPMRGAT